MDLQELEHKFQLFLQLKDFAVREEDRTQEERQSSQESEEMQRIRSSLQL